MPDDRDQIAMPARLDAQDAEAVVAIVVGDAFNQTGEDFTVRRIRLIGWSGACQRSSSGGASRRPVVHQDQFIHGEAEVTGLVDEALLDLG